MKYSRTIIFLNGYHLEMYNSKKIILFIYILPVIYESESLSYNIISKFEKEIALENPYRNKKTHNTISLFNAFPLKSATFLFFSREKQIILRQHETINE